MQKPPRIVVTPPGPKARELLLRDSLFLSQSAARYYPLAIESGKGAIIKDLDGNEYIDFNSGIGCVNVGHCHPKVVEAIRHQSEKFIHYSHTDFYCGEIVDDVVLENRVRQKHGVPKKEFLDPHHHADGFLHEAIGPADEDNSH